MTFKRWQFIWDRCRYSQHFLIINVLCSSGGNNITCKIGSNIYTLIKNDYLITADFIMHCNFILKPQIIQLLHLIQKKRWWKIKSNFKRRQYRTRTNRSFTFLHLLEHWITFIVQNTVRYILLKHLKITFAKKRILNWLFMLKWKKKRRKLKTFIHTSPLWQ